jgi:hypothetical protein
MFRRWPLALGWLALVVVFFSPASEVLTPTLDGSNFASYAYFTAHHFQYGTEVVPMAGPYGFIMFGWVYNGELFGARLAAGLVLNGALAALTLWFFLRQEKGWLRWAWLAAHAAFTPFVEDLPIEWMLLLGGLFLLHRAEGRGATVRVLLVTGLVALLSLVKGTHLLLGLATLAVVLGGLAWQRQLRQAGLVAAAYVAAIIFFWLLAGQQPAHLPAYVRGILQLGGGYTEAMSIATPPGLFWRGLLVCVGLAAGVGAALWARRREAVAVAGLLLVAGHAFVQWKHSFVRADGHAYIYFHFATVAALAVALAGRARIPLAAAAAVVLLSILPRGPADKAMLPAPLRAPAATFTRLFANGRYLLHPAAARAGLENQLAAQRRIHDLPAVRHAVGRQPVDLVGYEHGLLALNGLDYRPRPMGGGSFNAYTPYLMQLNRDYVRDPARRPAFYLLKLQTIDQRLVTQDDGLALLEILQRYQPRLVEHEHLLLQAAGAAEPVAPRPVGRWEGTFGAAIPLPAVAPGEVLLARFDVRENVAGKLRAFVYKPVEVTIALTDAGGAVRSRRLVPAMARSPFLLSPRLEDLNDVVSLYEPAAGQAIREAVIATTGPGWFAPAIAVEFFAAPRPPALGDAALRELRARVEFPFANAVPESITPAFRPHHSVRFLHPPSEVAWRLAGDERAFSFHFGIDPEAYERGTTNGVEFILEIRGPSGGTQPVFKRLLRPREQAADRGDQEARCTLPVFAAGSRLVLRTGAGEYNDAAWDWAYASRMQLERGGAYDAALFPGFNRVPDAAEDENAAALDLDGRRVLLLHVPGTLRFNLTGRETQLALDFGFLPGAYTGGGNTFGAAYIVELQTPGQPARELARRVMQPVTTAADRGPQSLRVDLPAVHAGDVLLVRTAPLPGGNTSWGWTYFSRLVLE